MQVAQTKYAVAVFAGGHLNPAVSLGFVLARKISVLRFFCYVIMQLAGATTGSALVYAVSLPSLQSWTGLCVLSSCAAAKMSLPVFLCYPGAAWCMYFMTHVCSTWIASTRCCSFKIQLSTAWLSV